MIVIKTEEQINGIRESCKLAAAALKYAENLIKPGVSTEYIDAEIEKFIRLHDGVPATLGYHGYPKSSCTSINEVICHGIPKEEDILKEGDIIKIDVSTILNGYFGDTCQTFMVGEVSEEAKNLVQTAKDCLDIGIAVVKPNIPFGLIGTVISRLADLRGFSVVYQFTGHGVGLSLHESPHISHDDMTFDTTLMQPGMVFTIEPMINAGKPEASVDEADRWTARTIDNRLSAQFEHTICVTKNGFEILTV